MNHAYRTMTLVFLLTSLATGAGNALGGVEPSPFAASLGSQFDPSLFWVLFDPQPEPPGFGMNLDFSNPTAPRFLINNDSHGAFHLEFAVQNSPVPLSGFFCDPVGDQIRLSALGGPGPLYTAMLSFESNGFPLVGSDILFDPQPEPPGYPGGLMNFNLYPRMGEPPFEDGGETAMTLQIAGPDGNLMALHPVPEPATILLLAAGLGGMLLMGRKRGR